MAVMILISKIIIKKQIRKQYKFNEKITTVNSYNFIIFFWRIECSSLHTLYFKDNIPMMIIKISLTCEFDSF